MTSLAQRIFLEEQKSGRDLATKKLPSWAENPKIIFPRQLSMEQCSSEETARYKASLMKGKDLLDLTGGFGVDASYLSRNFEQTTYIEASGELCQIAQQNFDTLGLTIKVCHTDAVDYLNSCAPVACIYIDPARRAKSGSKVFGLADCTPNVLEIREALFQKAQQVLIKASPMLDISAALTDIGSNCQVHVVALKNECKELLFLSRKGDDKPSSITCINLPEKTSFSFDPIKEKLLEVNYALPLRYLYEPNAAILKAGAFKSIAQQYNLQKLHPSSHLYTSAEKLPYFPGRSFEITGQNPVHKQHFKDLTKANLSTRNFPSSVAVLRKKLNIKDGGDTYLFATTLYDESRLIIRCKKI